MMQFQGLELVMDHGTLQVDTAREMEVIVGCTTISPVNSDRTQFDVVDANGIVKVSVSKNDVKIHWHGATLPNSKGGSADAILHPGEHATRPDQCASATRTPAPGVPGLLDTPTAGIAGGIVAATLICLGICHGDNPISPDKP
jgi:ferric-dicitrate binding protein FerR (iron transport regulator)